jgi:YebC/PmpR family DNA-binding regulatory protein
MSGHSKWATIKHKKGAADKARGKLFAKLIRQVEVAAREGGGDPDTNPTLRTMFQKAREASVPLDTIDRAIKRGTGELEGVRYEQVSYEGYAPSGVAVIVECLTDNRNRTGADIRSVFSKNGGSMAEPGSVSWQFERKGVILVTGSARSNQPDQPHQPDQPDQPDVTEDDLMLTALDAGAEDITDAGDHWQVITPPAEVAAVRTAIEEAGMTVDSAEVTLLPSTTVPLNSESDAKKVLHVVDLLEEHDDVQNVYANFDIPDSILELVGA